MLEKVYNYKDKEQLDILIEDLEKRYKIEVNSANISKGEFFKKEFNILTNEAVVTCLIHEYNTKEECMEYLKDTREEFIKNIVDYFDGVKGLYTKGVRNQYITTNSKLKRVGRSDSEFTYGKEYRIVEINNWFHNKYELGYYITTDDYSGYDVDYCVFYPLGLEGHFEVVNK